MEDSEGLRTPRIMNSMNLLEPERWRKVEMALDQDVVSWVVVLAFVSQSVMLYEMEASCYSFAKTPLKAAQAPLAAARASHGAL